MGFLVTHYLGDDLTKMRLEGDALTVLVLFRQVVEAAAAAHAAGIVHRDIKPDNIVCDHEGRVSLIDFGICAEESNSGGLVLTTVLEGFGNRSFAAPECEAGSFERASAASDVYSLGKVLYWLATAQRKMVRERFRADDIVARDSFEKYCVAELVARTVVEEPQQRWTTSELLGGIDWVTEKLQERRQETPARIVVDGFGPNSHYNESGLRSATTPPQGNPPAVNYVGQAFQIDCGQCGLSRIELAISRMAGDGRAEVRLAEEEDGQPGAVIKTWKIEVERRRSGENLVVLRPDREMEILLEENHWYWLYVVASSPNANVAWWSGDQKLRLLSAKIGELHVNPPWSVSDVRGTGYALKVVVMPVAAS
jgi:serine/threonine protein kinase